MDGALRRLRLFGLAARPDQVVCAVLAFDQAGIDRCRERWIIKGHGHIRASGLAGLFPRCADVVTSRRDSLLRTFLVERFRLRSDCCMGRDAAASHTHVQAHACGSYAEVP